MSFGVYIHIPYCLQRCVYCDFATYESSQILPPEQYINHVCDEIKLKAPQIGPKELDTIYFGGGTPSLLDPQQLNRIVEQLKNTGFTLKSSGEFTIEVNPATANKKKIEEFLKIGVNRFSLGAQTFRDDLLKLSHRKHTAQDTIETLELFKSLELNFSVDILFALPLQTTADLRNDLDIALRYGPKHVSPYCLTVPESNPMSKNRPLDTAQVKMFAIIEEILNAHGFVQYEISNFAIPGFESRHNMLYWDDQEYWGIGLSSHSYMKWGDWGTRFWNPRQIEEYTKEKPLNWETPKLHERLKRNEALTDYFHTSLRRQAGLNKTLFLAKFGQDPTFFAGNEIKDLIQKNWLVEDAFNLKLTAQGKLLSNKVFEALTFLPG